MSVSKSHNIASFFSVKQEMLASYGSFSKKARGLFFEYWKNVTLFARVTEDHHSIAYMVNCSPDKSNVPCFPSPPKLGMCSCLYLRYPPFLGPLWPTPSLG